MATCSPTPYTVDEGLDYFLSHNASGSGMCAQMTWWSLGGQRGCPPAWGCANANEVYDKVKASGRYWTTPKRGDIALWKYGQNGHAARVYDDAGTLIATTNPSSDPSGPGTGIEPIGYPAKWGATTSARIFTDTYNGVKCFVSGEPSISHGDVHLDRLVYGQQNSDSVKRLQMHLNAHPLEDGSNIPITGNYGEKTDKEVRLCQEQHGYGSDPVKGSSVGPQQAEHLFTSCACVLIGLPEPPEPQPPEPEEPDDEETTISTFGLYKWYSGKESSEVRVHPDGDWHDICKEMAPSNITEESSEIHFLYLRIALPAGRTASRNIETRWVRSNGDETAYKGPEFTADSKDSIPYENMHIEDGSGLGGQWQIRVYGGTDPIVVTTRYAKTHIFYQDQVVVLLGETLRASGTAFRSAVQLLKGLL